MIFIVGSVSGTVKLTQIEINTLEEFMFFITAHNLDIILSTHKSVFCDKNGVKRVLKNNPEIIIYDEYMELSVF